MVAWCEMVCCRIDSVALDARKEAIVARILSDLVPVLRFASEMTDMICEA